MSIPPSLRGPSSCGKTGWESKGNDRRTGGDDHRNAPLGSETGRMINSRKWGAPCAKCTSFCSLHLPTSCASRNRAPATETRAPATETSTRPRHLGTLQRLRSSRIVKNKLSFKKLHPSSSKCVQDLRSPWGGELAGISTPSCQALRGVGGKARSALSGSAGSGPKK